MTKNSEILIQVDLLNTKPEEGKRNLTGVFTETCPQKGVNPGFCENEFTNRESELNVTANQPARMVKCTPEGHTSSKCSSFLKYLAYVSILYTNLLSFGIASSLGILYIYLIREFNTTKSETAMITSACGATLGCGGIFAGMLYRKIGVGWSFIVASALCSIGLFASSFTPNIWFLFFSLGILFGGTFYIFAPLCNTYSALVFLVVLNGFSRGMLSTIRPLVFKKVVGVEAYPLAIGYTYTLNGICAIPLATIVGKITDLTHSYDFAFYLTGLFETLMFLLLASSHLLITWMRKKNHKFKPEN
ncbi:Hypothetical predicted protein [Octopus vulgaris]|uniref:Major facilitator superfamily (MFS) profile domain-containing protein n=1 Tax=Octopus vulgaris TaxID=6645 RepID=A0AA36FJW5_OCTVU|nr:Hypothetical predicted protein [Octopus vulgaris]